MNGRGTGGKGLGKRRARRRLSFETIQLRSCRKHNPEPRGVLKVFWAIYEYVKRKTVTAINAVIALKRCFLQMFG